MAAKEENLVPEQRWKKARNIWVVLYESVQKQKGETSRRLTKPCTCLDTPAKGSWGFARASPRSFAPPMLGSCTAFYEKERRRGAKAHVDLYAKT